MPNSHLLPLETALRFLKVTKAALSAQSGVALDVLDIMEKHGVTLDGAEAIAISYGYHPSEIWGDTWVDAVLTLTDWTEASDD